MKRQTSQKTSASRKTTPKPLKLLLVDDNPALLELTIKELWGFEVFTADSAQAGMRIARAEHPKIIWIDYDLGELSGEIVLKKILKALPETKIIMAVYELTPALKKRLLKQGCHSVLPKETPLFLLRQKMAQLIS